MKTRQFQQLAGLPPAQRDALVEEGLSLLAERLQTIATELTAAKSPTLGTELATNVAGEEAGKALLMLDVYRSPNATQKEVARQFRRARDHLAKLLYDQMTAYRIATTTELRNLIDHHRSDLYLDGPNEYDWIFRNELLATRESYLYVDLVESDGKLEWWPSPTEFLHPPVMQPTLPDSAQLVLALQEVGILSQNGFAALREAWMDFDPLAETRFAEWTRRSSDALDIVGTDQTAARQRDAAQLVAHLWIMPLTEIDIEKTAVPVSELVEARDRWRRRRDSDETEGQ